MPTLNNEKILWQGKTGRAGGVLFSAKISLFICLLLEAVVIPAAFLLDIGLANKWQAFGILQAPVFIMAFLVFFVGCTQVRKYSYVITEKKVYINFGQTFNVYFISDITKIKVKYGFWERDKKRGTVKISVRNKWLTALNNNLYSVPEPELVIYIIQKRIERHKRFVQLIERHKGQTPEDITDFLVFCGDFDLGYKAELFEPVKCEKCGGGLFGLEAKRENQLYKTVCKACGYAAYIEDSGDFWEDTEEEITTGSLAVCGHSSFYLVLGYALHADKSKKRLYIGYLCGECMDVGSLDVIELR